MRMKWMCPLPTSATGFFLFVRCCAAEDAEEEEEPFGCHSKTRDGKRKAAGHHDGAASHEVEVGKSWAGRSTTAAEGRTSVQSLLTSAMSFLAPSEPAAPEEGPPPPPPPSGPARLRPTTADIRRKAAALSKGQTGVAPRRSKGERGAVQPVAPAAAAAAAAVAAAEPRAPAVRAATTPRDRLHFLLVGPSARPGKAAKDGAVHVWAPRGPVAVSRLVPPGMDSTTYCELLDHLLRSSHASEDGDEKGDDDGDGNREVGALEAVLSPDVVQKTPPPSMCRVELLVSIGGRKGGGGRGSFVLAAVELFPEDAALPTGNHGQGTRLGDLLRLLSAHVKVCNDLWRVVDRQAAEIAELRAAISQSTATEKASVAEHTLLPLCDILNAKKQKICELTAALKAQRDHWQADDEAKTAASATTKKEPREETPRPAPPRAAAQRRESGHPTSTTLQRDAQAQDASTDSENDSQASDTTGDSTPAFAARPLAAPSKQPSIDEGGKQPKRQRIEEGQRGDGTSAWVDELFQL